jgi:multidrug efflux pump subunit AcrA (membrane-fusion protein)
MFNFKGRVKKFFTKVKQGRHFKKIPVFIRRRPMTAFFITLGLLFLLIVLGNFFKTPAQKTPEPEIVKDVTVLTLGHSSVVKVSGLVEKQGILQISAQNSGVVSKIHVTEGEFVAKGDSLVNLSSNYQGAVAPSISRQIAAKQYQNSKDTFASQKEIIAKQKEIAELGATNTEELRKIAVQSNTETNSLLNMNQDILRRINDNLETLEQNNPDGINDPLILQTRQAQAQVQQGINVLQSQIRNFDYQNNTDNPPTKTANINKEVTLKQLEIQEKTLSLNKEVAALQVSLAAISESLMFPVSPCGGSVEKIHVVKGELVNPGMNLVTIACEDRSVKVIAKVPGELARSTSSLLDSTLFIKNTKLFLAPDFISTEATDGQLYQIVYILPEIPDELTDGSFVKIELPVGQDNVSEFFIPLDSVFQTQEDTFVYIVEEEKAVSRKVTLGEVLGAVVEIKTGLNTQDRVILNRNVIAGDKVKINE